MSKLTHPVTRRAGIVLLLSIVSPAQAADQSVAANGNIQAAIDACASSGGGTVTIGSGTGTVSASLRMKSNVTLKGAGNPATTLNAGGDFQTIIENGEGLSNLKVQNMKVYGRGTGGSDACCGVYIEALTTPHSGVAVSGVQITNFAGIGSHMKRTNNSSSSSNNFHNNGKTLYMHNLYVHTSNNLAVSGCQLNDSPIGTGYRHTAGSGCSVKTTTTNSNGQNGHNIFESPSNFTIDGCTSNSNRNATAGRSDGIGFNYGTGSGTVKNCVATGNRVNYAIGSGYAQSNNK
jgi:polygalacturonase